MPALLKVPTSLKASYFFVIENLFLGFRAVEEGEFIAINRGESIESGESSVGGDRIGRDVRRVLVLSAATVWHADRMVVLQVVADIDLFTVGDIQDIVRCIDYDIRCLGTVMAGEARHGH